MPFRKCVSVMEHVPLLVSSQLFLSVEKEENHAHDCTQDLYFQSCVWLRVSFLNSVNHNLGVSAGIPTAVGHHFFGLGPLALP